MLVDNFMNVSMNVCVIVCVCIYRRYPAGFQQQVNIQPYSPTPPSTAKILRKWPSNSSVSR